MNAFGTYSIRYGQFSYDERIENMTIVDSENEQQMLEMYTHSSLIALCLPEQAIEAEAKIIAKDYMLALTRHLKHVLNH